MMKLWKYIDEHHEDFGVALFVIPPLVAVFVLAGIIQLVCAVFW